MSFVYCQLSGVLLVLVSVYSSSLLASESISITEPPSPHVPFELPQFDSATLAINIDGHLREHEWSQAGVLGEMRVTRPDTLAKTPYRTDVRVLYTDEGLYVGFDMEQPQHTLIRRISGRDARRLARDRVSFTLDTSGKGLYGYWMGLALGDNQLDGTILPERRYGSDWDGAWYGATQITDSGWSAEFFIPWSQIAMPKSDGVRQIGIYLQRNVASLNQSWSWPALNGSDAKFLSAFEPLGLQGVDPRKQWSVFPYISGTRDVIDNDNTTKAGFDIFWRPSSNFQLTSTVNPDFGSVESDNVVVNLSADETFFSEKRLFFQEGQDIFKTSPRASSRGGEILSVVNTRRIGGRAPVPDFPEDVELNTQEKLQFAPLYGAVKATGQLGNLRYGLLGASEKNTRFSTADLSLKQPGRDFGVVRFLYESKATGAYRALGFISTLVSRPDGDAKVHGLDFHYLTASGKWNLDGQLLHSDVIDIGKGKGVFFDLTYVPRRGIRHTLSMEYLDDKLDINDLGFQRRSDLIGMQYRMTMLKSDLNWARDIEINPFMRLDFNEAGQRTRTGLGSRLTLRLLGLDEISAFWAYFPKRYEDRNSFGNGTYEIQSRGTAELVYRSDRSKKIDFEVGSSYNGESIKGRRLEAHVRLGWKPQDNLSLGISLRHVDRNSWLLHQDEKDFTTFNAKQWHTNFNFDYWARTF